MSVVIGVDLDSTLNRLDKKWLEVYNEKYNDCLTIGDWTCWDFDTIVKPECGKKVYDLLQTPGFFYELEVQPDAQEVTEWLIKEKKVEIDIVTAYYPETVMDKVNWLSKYFPHIPTRNIMFCNHKGRYNGDYLIDDGGHNAEAFHSMSCAGIALLYDAPCPWNHYLGDKYSRMHNWIEIKKYFEEVLS